MDFTLNGKMVHAGTGGIEFDDSKPVIMFIHGASMDHTIWALQGRYFAHHGYSVLAIDLPGHGASEGPALESIEEMADWITSTINATGKRPVILVGHSMGAIIALETAAQNSEKITAIALAGIAVPMTVNPKLLNQTVNKPLEAINSIVGWAYSDRSQLGGTAVPGLWMLGGGRKLIERNALGQLHIDFKACDNYSHGLESAKNVKCPTLIIAGDDDKMTPAKASETLQRALTHSTIEVIRGGGHMMMIERPDQTLETLRNFIATSATLESLNETN